VLLCQLVKEVSKPFRLSIFPNPKNWSLLCWSRLWWVNHLGCLSFLTIISDGGRDTNGHNVSKPFRLSIVPNSQKTILSIVSWKLVSKPFRLSIFPNTWVVDDGNNTYKWVNHWGCLSFPTANRINLNVAKEVSKPFRLSIAPNLKSTRNIFSSEAMWVNHLGCLSFPTQGEWAIALVMRWVNHWGCLLFLTELADWFTNYFIVVSKPFRLSIVPNLSNHRGR